MQTRLIPPQPKLNFWHNVTFDFTLVLLTFVLTFTASSYFNLFDQFYAWSLAYENTWDFDELPIALVACLIVLLWFLQRRIYESSILMNKNHALLQRVLEIQETERKRIAQDLHDELGQYLNAIKVQATSLLIEPINQQDTRRTAPLIVSTADHAYQSARHMMQSLRPVALDELGLSAALEHLVNTWRAAQDKGGTAITKTSYQLTIEHYIDSLSEAMNIAAFRIVQEALNNISKHAQASTVVITVKATALHLILIIEDDGVGFEYTATSHGYGLLGMQERVDTLRGNFMVNTKLNHGTHITVKLPIRQR